MVLTLYKLNASPPARSVLMLINKLNIPDVQYVDVNILKQEQFNKNFVKINPQHTIPTLVDDDFVLWDSHAICTYLVNKFAENDPLYPNGPKQRAVIDQRMHFDNAILFSPLRETVGSILFGNEKYIRQEFKDKIQTGYDLLEKFLDGFLWVAGDELTVADVCCVSSVSSLNELVPINSNEYPNLQAWLQRCSQNDFYKKFNEPGLADFKDAVVNRLYEK